METEAEEVEVTAGQRQDPAVSKKLDEILKRIANLEKKEEKKTNETQVPWTEVLGRQKKGDSSAIKTGRGTHQEAEEENRRKSEVEKKKKRATPLQTLRRRIPRGAGVLIEIQGGTQKEYENIIRRCQREISLKDMGIPPVGIRKARAGGILLEIKWIKRKKRPSFWPGK